jgi:hypothetical protein
LDLLWSSSSNLGAIPHPLLQSPHPRRSQRALPHWIRDRDGWPSVDDGAYSLQAPVATHSRLRFSSSYSLCSHIVLITLFLRIIPGKAPARCSVTHKRTRTSRWASSWCTIESEHSPEKRDREGISITTQLDANDSPQKASESSESRFGFLGYSEVLLPPCLAVALPCLALPLARSSAR